MYMYSDFLQCSPLSSSSCTMYKATHVQQLLYYIVHLYWQCNSNKYKIWGQIPDNVLKACSFYHLKASSEEMESRRSSERERKRKPIRFQSPSEDELKAKKKRRRRLNPLLRIPRRDPGIPFKCDLCGSPYVIDPSRRGNRPKLSSHHPSPRHKVDPVTGKTLTLCNACGRSIILCKIIQCIPCVQSSTLYIILTL